MFISKITPAKIAGRTPDSDSSATDAYKVHKMIWSFFYEDLDHDRDFIYRFESRVDGPVLITVSETKPNNYNGLWEIHSMEYNPVLREGQVLDFVLTANPVRNKKDSQGRFRRHDVVMDAKWKYKNENESGAPPPPKTEIIRREGLAWLAARSAKNGFLMEDSDVWVGGYKQHTFQKRDNGNLIRLSVLNYSGRLTVSNPEKLRKVLYKGIGPAKSFGCGLMLIREAKTNPPPGVVR